MNCNWMWNESLSPFPTISYQRLLYPCKVTGRRFRLEFNNGPCQRIELHSLWQTQLQFAFHTLLYKICIQLIHWIIGILWVSKEFTEWFVLKIHGILSICWPLGRDNERIPWFFTACRRTHFFLSSDLTLQNTLHNFFHIHSHKPISGFFERSCREGMVQFLPNKNVIKKLKWFTIISLGPKLMGKTRLTIWWVFFYLKKSGEWNNSEAKLKSRLGIDFNAQRTFISFLRKTYRLDFKLSWLSQWGAMSQPGNEHVDVATNDFFTYSITKSVEMNHHRKWNPSSSDIAILVENFRGRFQAL